MRLTNKTTDRKKTSSEKDIKTAVAKVASQIASFPWEDKIKYANWLAQTYFYVQHTSSFLKLSESIFRKNGQKQSLKQTIQHQKEEHGHETLLLADLSELGFRISDFNELPFTATLYNYQYYWLRKRQSTAAHLAYSLFFEGAAAKVGETLVRRLKKSHGSNCCHFLQVHAGADVDHFVKGLSELANFNEEDETEFTESLVETTKCYSQILTVIASTTANQPTHYDIEKIASPQKIVGDIISELKNATPSFERIPEDSDITDSPESVSQYQMVGTTNMMANYCVTLDLAHRLLPPNMAKAKNHKYSAIDLASGPGLLTNLFVEQGIVQSVTGFDLSQAMTEAATKNSANEKVKFQNEDVRNLSNKLSGKYDLVTFNNSAHHFTSLQDVEKTLKSAEQLCTEDGVILLTDLARLPNRKCIDAFTMFAGSEFIRNQMFWMFDDFKRSLLAAWAPQELASAIPMGTNRNWYHITLADLPFYQAIIGLAPDRDSVFLRQSKSWEKTGLLKSPEALGGYFLMMDLLKRSPMVALYQNFAIKKAA